VLSANTMPLAITGGAGVIRLREIQAGASTGRPLRETEDPPTLASVRR
jgi:hypothetical protein